MSAESESTTQSREFPGGTTDTLPVPPTTPCTVVWSQGHAFVLEQSHGRTRWAGVDGRGRPQWLSASDLQRRGWTRRRP